MKDLRQLPSVQRVLAALRPSGLPAVLVTELVRAALAAAREEEAPADAERVIASAQALVESEERRRLVPVINATGVLLHTNLGRAPLCAEAVEAVNAAAREYSTLEYDLAGGTRGRRAAYAERCLAMLAGAEAAVIVNNCAAALVLVLHHFCKPRRREVVISRGELVQIGGGFRVPEILAAAKARLCEVGTTNQTSLADYERAIGTATAMLLRVHRSNFFIDGFASSPSRGALAELARKTGVPLVEDLGSGLVEKLPAGFDEPTVTQAHREGAQLVCFSGDKLFGGPQAGIITGSRAHVDALRREPLYRALRPDKLTLAALQATAEAHLKDRRNSAVPVMEMIRRPVEALTQRGRAIAEALNGFAVQARVVETKGCVGGGSLPRLELPSAAVALRCNGMNEEQFAARLRLSRPAVIGLIAEGEVRLDLRTVFPRQDAEIIAAVRSACEGAGG